ncbi:MAG: hypothetical protein HOM52_15855 [Rhodospirillaceae bacterium]|nr:hypothetical protein [Rhodospirillaceae bacterium]MBT3927987.1 hypothetical protein [Rhodospirillaceae bacterium]MBT4425536.1 hypothetical protein [Rhodospirillaceae bacterium]MBT5039979.1 hypothetical protein [Rhodospirillaceae bacterium]MBT5676686.1 hypothetical protein [Rhodospirillaceae bacterium]
MDNDLDLERVVNDPDYRRKVIDDLKRDEADRDSGDVASQSGKSGPPVDSKHGCG